MNQFFIERYIANDAMLRNLSDDQIARARQCRSSEELLSLAKQEGVELTDEQLDAVSGGNCDEGADKTGFMCPSCRSTNTTGFYSEHLFGGKGGYYCRCNDCHFPFEAQ